MLEHHKNNNSSVNQWIFITGTNKFTWVFDGIALNVEINMDLHHHHTISSQSYQPFSLLVEGVQSHQKKQSHDK